MAPTSSSGSERGRQRREAHYAGHVQGVGFRATVETLASGFNVTGFVRNLDDGRVQVVAEGSADELTRFFDLIARRMANYIRQATADTRPAVCEFDDFEIRS